MGGCRTTRRCIRRSGCAKGFQIIIVTYFFHVIWQNITVFSYDSVERTVYPGVRQITDTVDERRLAFIFLIFVGTGRRFSVVGGWTIDSDGRKSVSMKRKSADFSRFITICICRRLGNKIRARGTVGEGTQKKITDRRRCYRQLSQEHVYSQYRGTPTVRYQPDDK